MLTGLLIAVSGGAAGSFAGAQSVLKLRPANAMRPPAPPAGKNRISKLHFLSNLLLNSRGNIAVRGMMRNKSRSFFIMLGMMFSFGLLTLVGSYLSLIDDMLMAQYTKVQVYDGKVSFVQPVRKTEGVESILNLRGVSLAEAELEFPAELKNKHLVQAAIITGLEKNSSLFRIYDNKRKANLDISGNGIVLSDKLALKLEAKRGDVLYVSSPMLKKEKKLIVADVADISLGQSCFMEINELSDFLELPSAATSVIFNTQDMSVIKAKLINASNILTIQDRETIIESNQNLMTPISSTLIFLELMAIAVAFAIIYNLTTISLSERKREYATLRVLGLTVDEVTEIIRFETWILCIMGMILGIPFAKFLAFAFSMAIDMDLIKFPSTIHLYAYVSGVIGCIVAVFFSNISAARNIKRFDMVEVLKERNELMQ